ncbi:hypothetical protein LEP1GSC112_0238 [Leptospira interrogans serovar Pomona str. UT364]|nr:hypothetical protein LEP1GSC112_0238 [Leptospira interrogans serovar Pomona str. UT364]
MKVYCTYPIAFWNPQRKDQITPRFLLKDYQQCMGNVFQDFIVYVGMLKNIPDFVNLTTYNYYALLEDFIIKHKGNVYDSSDHAEHFNELMRANKIELRIVKKTETKTNFATTLKTDIILVDSEPNLRKAGTSFVDSEF